MDVIAIGESVVLLTPDLSGPIRYAREFSRTFDGAESNLAIGLVRLGHKAAWMSRIGSDEFGRAMLSFIRGEGVDVSRVTVDANRPTGLLFEEKRREDDVRFYPYYSHSAASRWPKEEIDKTLIGNTKYIYLSGFMPMMNEESFEATIEMVTVAKANQATIIFDLNTRRSTRLKDEERDRLLRLSALSDYLLVDRHEGERLLNVDHPNQFEVKTNIPGVGDGFATGFISGLLDNLGIDDSIKRGEHIAWLVNIGNGAKEDFPIRSELSY